MMNMFLNARVAICDNYDENGGDDVVNDYKKI